MSTHGWVLAPRFTAGFAGALLLLGGAVVAGRQMPGTALDALAATAGAALAAATIAGLNGQTRRRLDAAVERDRLLRAETTRAELTAAEGARTLDALRLSWEELLRASERARRDNERVRRLVDSNIIGVVFSRGGLATDANDAYLDIVGYTRADLAAGKVRWREMTPPAFRALDDRARAELDRRGVAAPFEKAFQRKDGTVVPVLVGVARLHTSPRETVAFVIDLTERHRTLDALRAAQAESESANHAKDEFLAVLSHELRSPLHAALGWLAILKKGLAAGHDVGRAVDTVERNLQLQARLVNDLLDVSHIAAHKLAIEDEPVDLPLIVHSTVDSARPEAAAKGVDLACAVALPAGAVIGDEKRLRQVVGNLLSNAVKLTPRGGRVDVTLASREGEAVLEVRDTGAGIPRDFLPHVFERFRQADGSSTRAYGGLGLGLSIAKTLVDLHGGHVAAASDGPGRGATFTVRVPLRAASLAPLPARADDEGPDALTGVTVMLLDDDPDGREALQLALEQAGAGVHAYGSAADARRDLALVAPDVIVSDIGMPGEDGYAFLRTVRASGDGCVPAVAITGFAGKQDRAAALRSGFDDHIPKPVDAGTLIAKLRDLVRRSGPRFREPAGFGAEPHRQQGLGAGVLVVNASPSPPPAPARRA